MSMNLSTRRGALAVLPTLSILALTLMAQQISSLVVRGQQGQASVIQVQGRNYVELEGLARVMNGTIGFNGNQVVLTLSGSGQNSEVAPAPAAGFSDEFKTAGIEAMAEIREWHTALTTAIERSIPINQQWLGAYGAKAQQALRLASVAIKTDSDKNVYPFLVNVFNNMKALSAEYVQKTKDMHYIDPNSLQSDPVDQKIVTCAHSLASMATTNQFVDDGSCQ
jgi:hypothetical protein